MSTRMHSQKVQFPVALVAGCSILFALGYYFLVGPHLKKFANELTRSTEYASAQAANSSSAAKTQKDLLASYAGQRTQALALLPIEPNMYDLSVQVEALAKSVPVGFTSITLSSGSPVTSNRTASKAAAADTKTTLPAGVQSSTVSVTISGSYDQIQQFVSGLTSLSRYLTVQDLVLTSGANGALSAQVTALAYNQSYGR